MPKYYMTSKVIDNLHSANATELDAFEQKLNGVLNQFFVSTADYSLERWEKELGLEVNNTYDTAFRRSRILSRLRGQGTVTIAMIKNVAESFSNGEVDVIEDNAGYMFTVKFVGTLGIPPNMNDLQKAIEDIKPAHLAFGFEYSYNTNAVLSAFTHAQLALYTHTQLREEVIS